MEELIYEDLLSVPFKKGGRTKEGMDCYGLCIELCRRCGKTLPDFSTYGKITGGNCSQKRDSFNSFVKKTENPKKHGLVEYLNENGEIHIGFLLDEKTYIHSTLGGVRVTPLFALKNPKFYEVTK